MAQLLAAAKRCQVKEAIAKARLLSGPVCCDSTPVSRKQVPLESTALQGQLAQCARISAAQAQALATQPLRGVPESVRIKRVYQDCLVQTNRFDEYQGPRVPVPCPPVPTILANSNLPKPSTRCDTLNLLATGSPPNNLPRP